MPQYGQNTAFSVMVHGIIHRIGTAVTHLKEQMMNQNWKLVLTALAAATALTACGTSAKKPAAAASAQTAAAPAKNAASSLPEPPTVNVEQTDGNKEVAYQCGNDKLNVMYGFKGNDVVIAQAKYNNELTSGLRRVIGVNDQNAFWGDNVAWITQPATAANVDKVNGLALTVRHTADINGKPEVVDGVVVKNCVPIKAAAAKAPAKAKKK